MNTLIDILVIVVIIGLIIAAWYFGNKIEKQ